MSQPALPRDAATSTSPAPHPPSDVPEVTPANPGVGLQSMHDTAVVPEKELPQSKGVSPEAIPPSPSALEHVNVRSGVRGAADSGQREDSGAEALKAGTVGVGEGATVSHLPDGGPPSGMQAGQQMMQFRVEDVHCFHCVKAITEAVRATDAEAGVEVDLESHTVRVASALSADDISAAIQHAGYTPVSVPPAGSSTSFMN